MPESPAANELESLVSTRSIPGIQYTVVDANGPIFTGHAGVTDVRTSEAVSARTTFMASSVTKTLTAAAVLQLHDRDVVELAAPLKEYIPDYPYDDGLEVRHLLNQTSGVPNPMPLKWLHPAEDDSDFDYELAFREAVAKYNKLKFAPGSRYAYSNLSYWLLGEVVSRVSGTSYPDYMRANVFGPLGLSDSQIAFSIPNRELHARGHLQRWSPLGFLLPWLIDRAFFDEPTKGKRRFKSLQMNGQAYGGLICTSSALATFLRDQLAPYSVLFSNETRGLFFSEQTDSQDRRIETTLGWHQGTLDGTRYYGKPGGGPGFQSNIRLYPDQGIASAWLANEIAVSEGPIHAVSNRLDRHFL